MNLPPRLKVKVRSTRRREPLNVPRNPRYVFGFREGIRGAIGGFQKARRIKKCKACQQFYNAKLSHCPCGGT